MFRTRHPRPSRPNPRPITLSTDFKDIARYFSAVHDVRERAIALEFLTAPANQSRVMRKSQKWQYSRQVVVSFIAYFYMIGELSSDKLRSLPVRRKEENDAWDWAIAHYTQEGFMNFPPTTFTKDTIPYLRHCDAVINACEPMQNHRQIATLDLLSSMLLQFFSQILYEGAEGAKDSSGVVAVTEATTLVDSLLEFPDEEYEYDDDDEHEDDTEEPTLQSSLKVSALGIGDRLKYKEEKGRDKSIEIVEVIDSARRGLVFTVAPPDSDDSSLEHQLTATQMEEILRVGQRV